MFGLTALELARIQFAFTMAFVIRLVIHAAGMRWKSPCGFQGQLCAHNCVGRLH
jgi:hypothetical protein